MWLIIFTWMQKMVANPLVQKVLIGIACLFFLFLIFRGWLQKHDDAILKEGKAEMSQELEKKNKVEWKKIEDQNRAESEKNKADAVQLQIREEVLNAKIAEDAKHRQREDKMYNQIVDWARITKERINADVTGIPAAELNDSIRVQSAKLPSTIRR